MSAAAIGLMLGLLVGVANYFLITRFAKENPLLKVVAVMDLVVMPAIGWAIGAYVFEKAL